ncbi:Galactose-1-phosphate uridylyltransferase [hydrothermal vent metagenome]|uniref:Galactose-1-phosphate uridylyltransferase n=1 Tax=hydrothermal vent metagenome TaxID=652676 RepID=A0A1W1BDM0_9ZZZZ
MSDIRRDRLYDRYVLIAPERMRRPDKLSTKPIVDKIDSCPFCEGHEHMTPSEIYAIRDGDRDEKGWSVRVIPNLYKALQVELNDHSQNDGMFESRSGVGAHEVVIDTTDHYSRFSTMSVSHIADWLSAISSRISDLRNDKRLVYASVFKNSGEGAGATQPHPHTQILALPIMPDNVLRMMEKNLQYYRRHGHGKVEDILANEIREEVRIVAQKGDFTAYCPFASSYPFEVIIAPRKALMSIDELNRDDIAHLAQLISDVFKRLDAQLGEFEYNLAFNLSPLNSNFENEEYFPHLKKYNRMTIRIMPRIYRLGGFELSTGILINPVEPEEAAKLLREFDRNIS